MVVVGSDQEVPAVGHPCSAPHTQYDGAAAPSCFNSCACCCVFMLGHCFLLYVFAVRHRPGLLLHGTLRGCVPCLGASAALACTITLKTEVENSPVRCVVWLLHDAVTVCVLTDRQGTWRVYYSAALLAGYNKQRAQHSMQSHPAQSAYKSSPGYDNACVRTYGFVRALHNTMLD